MSTTSLVEDDVLAWKEGVRKFEEGNMEDAYQQFCDVADQTSCIVFNLATVHLIIGNFQEAYGLYTEALEKDPCLTVAFYQRAVTSHWMNRNEDALEDFSRALEMMRESHVINYSQLGMDLVLCSFQIHSCLAVVKSCLNLNEGARRSQQRAVETKRIAADDPMLKEKVKEISQTKIPAPSSMLADPCMSGHRFGACPLSKLDPPPIFKPRGVAQKMFERHQQQNESDRKEPKAKVLWYSDASYNFVGFQGAKHKNELMPMFIRMGKKRKASKGMKEPPKAIAGLIKAASPQLVNVKPSSSPTGGKAAGAPKSKLSVSISPSQQRQRRSSLSPTPDRRSFTPETEFEVKLSRRFSSPMTPTILVEDRTNNYTLNASSTSSLAIPEEVEEINDKMEMPQRPSSGIDDYTRLARLSPQPDKQGAFNIRCGRSNSIEVLCQESPQTPNLILSRETSPDDRSYTSSPQPKPNHLPLHPATPEINTHVSMTAPNLRALADLLEKLQSSNSHSKVAVHVHFHSEPENGCSPTPYQAT